MRISSLFSRPILSISLKISIVPLRNETTIYKQTIYYTISLFISLWIVHSIVFGSLFVHIYIPSISFKQQ